MKIEALWEIVQTRLIRRNVPVKNFKAGDIQQAGGSTVRRVIALQQGIPTEAAKEIMKFLKDKKLKKVQAAIMADQVRVSAPAKDELQEAMSPGSERAMTLALIRLFRLKCVLDATGAVLNRYARRG